MSIKLYGGRRLDGDLGAAYRVLLAAKPDAVRMCGEAQARWTATEATRRIDGARIAGKVASAPASAAHREMLGRQTAIETTGRRDPDVDPEFEVWLLPEPEGAAASTLAILRTESRQLREWFDALPFVHDHSYWDNSEGPEDVSDGDWERRRDDWARVMPHGVPSDTCLTFRLAPAWPASPESLDLLAHVPSVEVRLARIAASRHLEECWRTIRGEEGDDGPDLSMGRYFEAERRAGADGVRRAAILEEMRPFVSEVTMDDLFRRTGPEDDVHEDGPVPSP